MLTLTFIYNLDTSVNYVYLPEEKSTNDQSGPVNWTDWCTVEFVVHQTYSDSNEKRNQYRVPPLYWKLKSKPWWFQSHDLRRVWALSELGSHCLINNSHRKWKKDDSGLSNLAPGCTAGMVQNRLGKRLMAQLVVIFISTFSLCVCVCVCLWAAARRISFLSLQLG